MKIGSLCAGYGGLEEGVRAVLGGDVAWQSEIDPGACKILAHRYPGVPNIGDMTTVNWAEVEPIDVLCGGTPCQDLSAAGKRLGMREGTRSNLWVAMRDAIAQLRPGLVVWENVRGALSAPASSDMELREGRLGDGDDGPVLRALGRVLGDLADLGYDASWQGLRAADVGAPHGRFRVFVVAWPAADAHQPVAARLADTPQRAALARAAAGRGGDDTPAHADRLGHERSRRTRAGWGGSADDGLIAAHPEGHGRHEGRTEPARLVGGSDAALGGHAAAADADRDGLEGVGRVVPLGRDADRRGGADGDGHATERAADANTSSLRGGSHQPDGGPSQRLAVGPLAGSGGGDRPGHLAPGVRDLGGASAELAWGPYAAAIHRWERVLGRPAPAPTELSAKGSQRLSPRFVEWMQGLPAGWVTDVPGLSRNDQLKALGNGVVPQQAAAALRLLLPDVIGVAA